MAIRGAQPARFTPRGVSDTLSASDSPAGACRALTNLIFDPSTPNVFQCRPAAFQVTDFTGITTPGVISVGVNIGGIVYGMIGSALNAGKDQPFAYNTVNNSFVAVSNITNANTPATQSTSGNWTPPTMDQMGTMVIVTHPGFPGGVGAYFGWFDLSVPGAPVWNAGNTAGNALVAVPTAVKQFNNRAYFVVEGNTTPFTDALTNPPTITNANQILTIGDDSIIYGLGTLPFQTTTGGIVQGLLPFKARMIYQITGDSTTNDLAVNVLNPSTGTQSPRTIVNGPDGLFYMDDDGLRKVTLTGGIAGPDPDVRVPFINALLKSRTSAAYNEGIFRICVQNGAAYNNPYQEYWLDTTRGAFTGPHPFRQDLALDNHPGHSFVVFDSSKPGKMYQSDPVQSATSSFTEFGALLQWLYQTSPIGEPSALYANSSTESTIMIAFSTGGQQYPITAQDESGGSLATAVIQAPAQGAIWGLFNWGAALWGAIQFGLRPVKIPWTNPLVFSKVIVTISGPSTFGFKIGALKILYKVLKYLL